MSMERLVFLVSAMNTGGAETFLIKLYRKQEKTKYRMDFCVDHPKKDFMMMRSSRWDFMT